MSTYSSLPTVYEEDEAKQEDLDMEDPPAAEEAAAALAIADLQNSGTDHSAVAGGQATATPSPFFQQLPENNPMQPHVVSNSYPGMAPQSETEQN